MDTMSSRVALFPSIPFIIYADAKKHVLERAIARRLGRVLDSGSLSGVLVALISRLQEDSGLFCPARACA